MNLPFASKRDGKRKYNKLDWRVPVSSCHYQAAKNPIKDLYRLNQDTPNHSETLKAIFSRNKGGVSGSVPIHLANADWEMNRGKPKWRQQRLQGLLRV
jgi:hypothetical protein